VSRRLSFLAALVVAVVAVAPALARDPLDEQRKLTKADNALAAAAVLRGSDLPAGFVRTPSSKDNSDFSCGVKQPDLSAFTVTGESVRDFEDKTRLVGVVAGVQIFKSASDARADFIRGALPTFKKCLERILASQKARVTSSSFSKQSGVGERAVRYSVVGAVKSANGDVLLHADFLVAQQGRAQTFLFTIAPLRSPTGQELLLRLMTIRAQKAPSA
jgi:hypothetical protein